MQIYTQYDANQTIVSCVKPIKNHAISCKTFVIKKFGSKMLNFAKMPITEKRKILSQRLCLV